MDNAFTYIKENHGIDTEQAYPYEGKVSILRCWHGRSSKQFFRTRSADSPKGQLVLMTLVLLMSQQEAKFTYSTPLPRLDQFQWPSTLVMNPSSSITKEFTMRLSAAVKS